TTAPCSATPWPRSPIAPQRRCVVRPPDSPTCAAARRAATPARSSRTCATSSIGPCISPKASTSGRTRSPPRGSRIRRASSRRSRRSMTFWRATAPSAASRRSSSRDRSPTRSRTRGRSTTCAAWAGRRCAARATRARRSPPAASPRTRRRRRRNSTSVRAIVVGRTGGPEELTLREIDKPQPEPHEALVRLEAIGVNFIDLYFREGRYPAALPFIPGQEGAGVVEAVGKDAKTVSVGDRVAYTGGLGAYAQYATVPANRLVKVPEKLGARDAASAMLQGM